MDGTAALRCIDAVGRGLVVDQDNHINGLAVGQKDGGAIGQGEWCITAFVSRKLTSRQLEQERVRPFEEAVSTALKQAASEVDDVVTDVVETGAFELLAAPQRGKHGGNPPALNAQKPFRSLRCGVGITNPETTGYPDRLSVGTAGFYMTDGESLYIVSNNHVIAGSNTGVAGQAVVQPGTLDLTSLELAMMPALADLVPIVVGGLTDFVPVTLDGPGPASNRVDVALARVDVPSWRTVSDVDRLTFGGRILGVARSYDVQGDGSVEGSPRVYKVGRTTGYTEGVVTNIAARVRIPYADGWATFVDQIVVEQTEDNVGSFSDPGDSGSAVLNDSHEVVGLLFAGSPSRTLINPIAPVVDSLRARTGLDLRMVHA